MCVSFRKLTILDFEINFRIQRLSHIHREENLCVMRILILKKSRSSTFIHKVTPFLPCAPNDHIVNFEFTLWYSLKMKTNFFISFVNNMSYIELPIYEHPIYINFNLNKKLPNKKNPTTYCIKYFFRTSENLTKIIRLSKRKPKYSNLQIRHVK